MNNDKKIILTGGGTAGHVTPNIALIPSLKEAGYKVKYIGSKDGIEKDLIKDANVEYYEISSGKLRRYFDVKNFTDPFKVMKGVADAVSIIRKEKPNIIFSKGGFVAVPVVIAAKLCKVPVIAHESDITPGLANKLSVPYCNKVCVTFPEAKKHIKDNKGILTGTPIRAELFKGSKVKGLELTGLSGKKPIILIMGGSQGSAHINEIIRGSVKDKENGILKNFDLIHLCGKGNKDEGLENAPGYVQIEYAKEELKDLLETCDAVISRAGANSIFEFLALKKPNILIPLSAKVSRGDQILNAKSFEKSGYSLVIDEDELTQELLMEKVNELWKNKDKYIINMNKSEVKDGIKNIMELIKKYSK